MVFFFSSLLLSLFLFLTLWIDFIAGTMSKEDVPYDTLYAFILEKCAQLKIEQIDAIMVFFFFSLCFLSFPYSTNGGAKREKTHNKKRGGVRFKFIHTKHI
jgi:hypothetical protein